MVKLAPIVLLLGCSESSAPPPKPKQLAGFSYQATAIIPEIEATASSMGVVLEIDGKRLGEKLPTFTLPRTTLLGAAKLALLVPTNCGEERVPITAAFSEPEEAARADLEAWVSNGGNKRPITFGLRRTGAWPASRAIVHVDNSRGTKDAVVKIGDEELVVTRGKGLTTALAIGTCAEARTVKIAGKVVGELFDGPQATLIDVAGGGCYVYATTTYAAETAEGVPDAPPPEYVRNKPGQHLVQVRAAGFMATNPTSVLVRGRAEEVRNAVDMRTSLNPIACAAIR